VDIACESLRSGKPLNVWNSMLICDSDHKGTNVDISPDVVDLLSDSEVDQLRQGSQAQIAAWYTYTGLICKYRSSHLVSPTS
jgi:hypothetical protein